MKTKIIVGAFAIAIAFSMFLAMSSSESTLKRYGLEGLSANEMVEKLEAMSVNPADLMASIDGESLRLDSEDGVHEYEVEGDVFYLSFAPYIENTHPCAIHNLSTCQAELTEETFDVVVENDDEVFFQGEATTHKNGFKGIWLPRDVEATITVYYDGLSAEESIETYADSPTCLTTLKLE